jgi:ectoine hydroxylase-related dioxygenase (phytanoyl-CoA dioxygenase family)
MSFEERGYDVVSPGLTREELAALDREFPAQSPNRRNLFLYSPVVEQLVRQGSVRRMAEEILGPEAFAVRAIFFNKIEKVNWHVPWHQDISIPVKARVDVARFTAFNVKEGLLHVNAPAEVLEGMVILRVALDAATAANGALELLPGSHRFGRLVDPPEGHETAVRPEMRAGDVLRMRPLLFHASAHSIADESRRVVHVEFAARDLPGGLEWATRIR